MRVNCLGVYQMTGISKKSGQPYNMAKEALINSFLLEAVADFFGFFTSNRRF